MVHPYVNEIELMLTKSQKLELVDILCRMITKEVPVSLEERIWMNKLVRNNTTARHLMCNMLQ